MNELNLCNYVVEKSVNGKFELTDQLNKRPSIYGFKYSEAASDAARRINVIEDKDQLTQFISAVQTQNRINGQV